MLKLEESHPFESLGPGSISKVNNIDIGGAGGEINLLFLRNQGFLSKIPKIFCQGLYDKSKIFSKKILLRLEGSLNLSLSYYPHYLVKTLNTYWTRLSPTSSLLRPDKLISILFCTGAISWMLDEVKSNKCFITPKKSVRITSCLEEACVYQSNSILQQNVKSNCFIRHVCS